MKTLRTSMCKKKKNWYHKLSSISKAREGFADRSPNPPLPPPSWFPAIDSRWVAFPSPDWPLNSSITHVTGCCVWIPRMMSVFLVGPCLTHVPETQLHIWSPYPWGPEHCYKAKRGFPWEVLCKGCRAPKTNSPRQQFTAAVATPAVPKSAWLCWLPTPSFFRVARDNKSRKPR